MSDIKKIRDYKKARQPKPEISKAHHRANINRDVELLTPIIDKVQKLPAVPVAESLDDLLNELNNGVKRAPVVVDMHDGRRVQVADSGELVEIEKPSNFAKKSTGIKSGAAEVFSDTTVFSKSELVILAKLSNE